MGLLLHYLSLYLYNDAVMQLRQSIAYYLLSRHCNAEGQKWVSVI